MSLYDVRRADKKELALNDACADSCNIKNEVIHVYRVMLNAYHVTRDTREDLRWVASFKNGEKI